jgi:phospholipase A1/A2
MNRNRSGGVAPAWTLACAWILVATVSLGWVAAVRAQTTDMDRLEACVLRELRSASALTTVGELRLRCATARHEAAPATAPTGVAMPPVAPRTQPHPEPAAVVQELLNKPASEHTLIERRVVSELRASQERFALLPHRPNYVLPVSVQHPHSERNGAATGAKDVESVFQISFKVPLSAPWLEGRLQPFFGYTGRAWWQVYDVRRSRPFREYNHEPELMLAMPGSGLSAWGWTHRATVVAFNHQSNGRSQPTSRSWNRLTGEVYVDHGRDQWASVKLWHRLAESAKTDPLSPRGDDNPDITRYLGHAELHWGHVSPGGHQFTLMARGSLGTSRRGAVQVQWSHPVAGVPALRWVVQGFSGYGDSLIDYNLRVQRIGVGLMLNDWF